MSFLPNMTNQPPGGWKYRVPETGQEFTEPSLDALIQKLLAHYKANGYAPPADLPHLIEDYICNKQPDYCTGNDPIKPKFIAGLAHTFHTVVQGTRTLLTWAGHGFARVDISLSEARAEVCSTCPNNQEPEGCTVCNINGLRELTDKISGKHATRFDDALKACKVCSCQLKAKTRIPHAILWQHTDKEQKAAFPARCWMITEAEKAT